MSAMVRRGALALGASLLAAPFARAEEIWNPTRPITLIVGFPPGGQTDIAARLLLPGLQSALGVPVLIDNKAGESGNLGTEAVMSARPDGYTLLVGNVSPLAINPHTMDGMTLDPREMVAIGLAQQAPLVLCANPAMQVGDLAGLRAWIAAQPPGGIHYGSVHTASLRHIAMEYFRERIGQPDMVQMPHRSSASAVQDLAAARFNLLFDGVPAVAPALRDGRLRGILVTGRTRCPVLPDIATAEEQGLADFNFCSWVGLFAPHATPPAIIARLNAALNTALAAPAIRESMARRGDEPGGGGPEVMARMMARDYARWGEVVRTNNIRAES